MKILSLLRVEHLTTARKIYIIILALLFISAAFLVSLPRSIFPTGSSMTVSLALVCEEADMIAGMLSGFLTDMDIVGDLYEVEKEEAERLLANEEIELILEIPTGVVDALINRRSAEIRIISNDAFIGSMCGRIGRAAVATMNRIQDAALAYYDTAAPFFENSDEFYDSAIAFDLSLISEALSRSHLVKIVRPVLRYQLQVVTLVVFIVASIIAVYSAVTASRHFAGGYIRRLKVHDVRFWHVWAVKALSAILVSIVLCLPFAWAGALMGFPLSFWKFMLSVTVVSFSLFCVCIIFVRIKPGKSKSGEFTLLGCFALLVLMLFAGGGFYPVYMMDMSFRLFNPAWLAHILCEWSLGGATVSFAGITTFLALPVVSFGAFYAKWRSAL